MSISEDYINEELSPSEVYQKHSELNRSTFNDIWYGKTFINIAPEGYFEKLKSGRKYIRRGNNKNANKHNKSNSQCLEKCTEIHDLIPFHLHLILISLIGECSEINIFFLKSVVVSLLEYSLLIVLRHSFLTSIQSAVTFVMFVSIFIISSSYILSSRF